MRNRKQPTEAQKAQAAERRERFKAICQRVSAMSEDQRAALALQCGPRKISGEPFSAFNSCLLLSQHPAPTVCAGFHDWHREGRMVRKGETGLMVWVPTKRNRKDSAMRSEHGNGDGNGDCDDRPGFILGYVFDLSQTYEVGAEVGAE